MKIRIVIRTFSRIKDHLFKAILLIILSSPGCAFIDHPTDPITSLPSEDSLRKANAQTLKIVRIMQTRGAILDTVPVGSILPFYSSQSLSLPENWRYCNGDVVEDEESPFYGKRLPNLIDERFLMGTVEQYGEEGGNNLIEDSQDHTHAATATRSGQHQHGGTTGPETTNAVLRQVGDPTENRIRIVEQGHLHHIEPDGTHTHNVKTSPAGNHNHGGDNRPRWLGILYIIKIK